MEDSPSRIKTSTEITAFSETVDLQAGRGSYDTKERERQSMRKTAHPEDQVGGCEDADPLGCHHDDIPPSGISASDCVQPVVYSYDVTVHTTNLGFMLLHR